MTAWLSRGINLPLALAAAALTLWSVSSSDPYSLRLLTTAGVFATAVLGYQFIFGHAGALSLAQGTFFGLGAYATGIAGSQFGLGFEITFMLSIALPMVIAAVVAAPVLRLESHYFALATLGIGQVVLLIAINWEAFTGGANGIAGVPGVSVFGFDVPRGWPAPRTRLERGNTRRIVIMGSDARRYGTCLCLDAKRYSRGDVMWYRHSPAAISGISPQRPCSVVPRAPFTSTPTASFHRMR